MSAVPAAIPFSVVVFDLDGTLIDSARDMTRVLNRTLSRFARPTLTEAQVRGMVGDGSAALVRQAFAATGDALTDEALQPALADYLDAYFQDDESAVLYPGVPETLKGLADGGVKLGLCTNKPERITRKLLDTLGLSPLFGALAGGDTLPVKKPDGRHLSWVVEALGGGSAAMVGDNRNDVKAARAAGLPVVAMTYGYPRMPVQELGADILLDRIADLPDALRRLGA
ncbi:HAD-IA family hydrolase [Azospirillum brasilense]|uniref:HAD-IA family hydrolase n=1 Tax=Azospirillum brasilense TaxID=192 RepID=UPI000E6A6EFF|nr:HAD-IA family hydrolase [Azospirillum brasilense]NUB25418.1 HAD-IA family hydrolase [Azospirillum brasilense]NUB32081.1 HAD-IA family hydrolase [Azospirillum brasilense]RIW01727.1 HAD family hydrolase [Azospirillum brasilense]